MRVAWVLAGLAPQHTMFRQPSQKDAITLGSRLSQQHHRGYSMEPRRLPRVPDFFGPRRRYGVTRPRRHTMLLYKRCDVADVGEYAYVRLFQYL